MGRPRGQRYPNVISSAVSDEVFSRIESECEKLEISVSEYVRSVLREHLDISSFVVTVSGETAERLRNSGAILE